MEFISWLGEFLNKNPWPSIVILFLLLILFIPWARFIVKDLLNSMGIKKLKISGAEIEFSREDKKVLERTFDEAIQITKNYRKKINNLVHREIQKTGLSTALSAAAAKIFKEQFENSYGLKNMRATIHVQDYLSDERLYQITNYYPFGDKAYRHFSLRRGIIGRVWRSQISACAGYLTHEIAPNPLPPEEELVPKICLEWGLTEAEALDFVKRPSYCCVPIKSGYRMLGLFYLDCSEINFGWDDSLDDIGSRLKNLITVCESAINEVGIPEILLEIENSVANYAVRRSIDV